MAMLQSWGNDNTFEKLDDVYAASTSSNGLRFEGWTAVSKIGTLRLWSIRSCTDHFANSRCERMIIASDCAQLASWMLLKEARKALEMLLSTALVDYCISNHVISQFFMAGTWNTPSTDRANHKRYLHKGLEQASRSWQTKNAHPTHCNRSE